MGIPDPAAAAAAVAMTDDVRDALDSEPWLKHFLRADIDLDELEDVDEDDLDEARVRFAVAQSRAVRELGATLSVRHSRGDLVTTSWAPHAGGDGRLSVRSRQTLATADIAAVIAAAAPQTVEVEEGGRFLRGVAVPYGEQIFMISPGRRGERVAHTETFDAQSVLGIGSMYQKPMLISHDPTRPTGRILASRSTQLGVEVEAELLGSDQELQSIRARAAGGVLAALSVGFVPNHAADVWHKPDARSGLPHVVRRGVEIREVSLVLWPAYDRARVTGIYARTAAASARHASSRAAIAATTAAVADAAKYLGRV
jgi:HK97 family phage prohead protease